MGFMIAGIAFLAIGAGLIFVAVRNALKSGQGERTEGSRRSSW